MGWLGLGNAWARPGFVATIASNKRGIPDAGEPIGRNCAVGLKVVDGKSIKDVLAVQ